MAATLVRAANSQDAMGAAAPPSPALTNPDMILPAYGPGYASGHSRDPSFSPPAHGAAAAAADAPPPALGRPMPGTWQSEEDVHASGSHPSTGAAHGIEHRLQSPAPPPGAAKGGGAVVPRPGAPLLAALNNPKLRASLAVDRGEYSPSIYSPTESELAVKSPSGGSEATVISPRQATTPEHGASGGDVVSTENMASPQEEVAPPVEAERGGEVEEVEGEETAPHDPVRAILDEDANDPLSHTALSLRAEEILANAKKRLTVRSLPTHLPPSHPALH